MRGSQRAGYRGSKPRKFSPRNGHARRRDKNALFDSDSFMKAIAATDDRQEFNKLTSPLPKSHQTPRLQRVNHENWQGVLSPAKMAYLIARGWRDAAPACRVILLQQHQYELTKSISVIQTHADLPPLRQELQLEPALAILQRICLYGVRLDTKKARATSSDRNLALPEKVFPKVAKQVVSSPPNGEHSAQGTQGSESTLAKPTLSAENGSNSQIASTEEGARVEHQPITSDIDGSQPVSSSQKARAGEGNTRRYDIKMLKRSQPANGGTCLPIAQKAALNMQSLLSLYAEPMLGCPAINVEHTNHFMKTFLGQAQKADHQDLSNHTEFRQPVNLCLAPSNQTEPTEANVAQRFEDENEITLDVAEAEGKKHDIGAGEDCAEEDAAEQSSGVIVATSNGCSQQTFGN